MKKALFTRREVLLRLSWVGVLAAGGMTLGPLVQYLASDEDTVLSPLLIFPKQLEEEQPWERVPNSRVWVRRDMKGTMALVSTCTHLGCEVRYHPDKKEWLCPCHGSVYDDDGNLITGPAKKGLPRVAVERKQDGSLIIHTNKQVGIDERA